MTPTRRRIRLAASSLFLSSVAVMAVALPAIAHPPAEGAHGSGCYVVVIPESVAVGGTITVQGFGYGRPVEIYAYKGTLPPGATPTTTVTSGSGDFTVTLQAQTADVGELRIQASMPETECGDTDTIMVTAALSNTAVAPASSGWLPFFAAAALTWLLAITVGRRSRPGDPQTEG